MARALFLRALACVLLLTAPRFGVGACEPIGPCLITPGTGTESIDLVFVIDGSSSTSGNCLFECERAAMREFLIDPARFPRDGSVAIAIIQFTNTCYVELPLTVIDTTNHAQLIACIERMSQRPHTSQGTFASPALQQAKAMLDAYGNGQQRLVLFATDGELEGAGDDWSATAAAARQLRQSANPAKVCTVMVRSNCGSEVYYTSWQSVYPGSRESAGNRHPPGPRLGLSRHLDPGMFDSGASRDRIGGPLVTGRAPRLHRGTHQPEMRDESVRDDDAGSCLCHGRAGRVGAGVPRGRHGG